MNFVVRCGPHRMTVTSCNVFMCVYVRFQNILSEIYLTILIVGFIISCSSFALGYLSYDKESIAH